MNKNFARITVGSLLAFSVFLTGMDGSGPDNAGRDGLAARQQELRLRMETLRSEQDLLLFQKQMSVVDSKYLILDLARGHGQLKYRSRVFLDFTFKPLPKRLVRTVPLGARALTKKSEGADGRFALVFGPALVLRTKSAAAPGRGVTKIIVQPKEMRSIFFALEEGSVAYILR